MKRFIVFLLFILSVIFSYSQANFTQIENDEWITGIEISHPAVTDLDGDGLYDLVVGDIYGKLRHYEQLSSGGGVFDFISYSIDDIEVGGNGYSKPVFEDIDNNGLIDMLVGKKDGRISRYEQSSLNSTEFTLLTSYFANIDVIYYASPTFTDIDDDGLLDLVVGGWSGYFHYWEQSSANSTTFVSRGTLQNTYAMNTDLDVGKNSTPTFTDLDNDGKLDLITGEEDGNLTHYEQTSSTGNKFEFKTDSYLSVQLTSNSAPCICNLDNDSHDDLLIGWTEGRMLRYEQSGNTSTNFNLVTEYFYPIVDIPHIGGCELYDITGDGMLDYLSGSLNNIEYWVQNSAGSYEFQFITDEFASISTSSSIVGIDIGDIDGDNLLDLIIGTMVSGVGPVKRYEQDAAGSTSFSPAPISLVGFSGDSYSCVTIGDADGNTALDILVGRNDGYIYHFEQDGLNSYTFNLKSTDFKSLGDFGMRAAPKLTDMDGDNNADLLITAYNDLMIHHYEKTSVNSNYYHVGDYTSGITKGYWNMWVGPADINGSGAIDLVVNEKDGGRLLHYNNSTSSWGGSSSNWSDPSNWNTNVVPDTLTEVTIPGGLSSYPVISDTASCKSLELSTGATITIQGGTLNIAGEDNN